MPENGIPTGWTKCRFGDVVTLQRGKDLRREDMQQGPYPVIGSSGVIGYHAEFTAHGPGVLVGRSGSTGNVTWVQGSYWPHNTTLWVADFHGNDPEFIYHLLTFAELGRYAAGVSVPTLNRNLVHPVPIVVPPISEQWAIARALRALQEAKEARRREADWERERKAALMQYLFTHGTRGEPRRQTEMGELPISWEIVRLGDVLETQLGKMLSQEARRGVSPRPYMRNANVQWNRVDVQDVLEMDFTDEQFERFRLRKGDLLVCEGGAIGRTALWRGEIDGCCFQKAIHRLRPKGDRMLPTFFLYYMEWAFRQADIYGVAGTQTTIAHLPKDKLVMMRVPCPAHADQRVIAEALEQMDEKMMALRREEHLLDELFRAMLEELMTGRLSAVSLIEKEASA